MYVTRRYRIVGHKISPETNYSFNATSPTLPLGLHSLKTYSNGCFKLKSWTPPIFHFLFRKMISNNTDWFLCMGGLAKTKI